MEKVKLSPETLTTLFPKGWFQLDLRKYGDVLTSAAVGDLARQDGTILLDEYTDSALVANFEGVKIVDKFFLDAWLSHTNFLNPGRTIFIHGIENDDILKVVEEAISGNRKYYPVNA